VLSSPEAVHVHCWSRFILLLIVRFEANLVVHADSVNLGSNIDEGEIEAVSVVRRHDCRLRLTNMLEPSPYQCRLRCQQLPMSESGSTCLVRFVEDYELSRVLRSGCIFEVVDVFANNLSIRDQEALPIDHVRYHHDLIRLLVGKFEGLFRCLDIVCHDHRFCSLDSFHYTLESRDALMRSDRIPQSDSDVWGSANP
jgi:hypothetical protein